MPAKNLFRVDEDGIYSHIYNKGIEKRVIFNDEQDYEIFLDYLRDYLTVPKDPKTTKKTFQVHGRTFLGTPHQPKNYFNKIELVAYSLMPDHFHLLLRQMAKGSLESFIRSLCTRYSIYFNKKYKRTGALFEGPYKSVYIKDESQLLILSRYLHHAGNHFSYPEYIGERETAWVKPEVVLAYLGQGGSGYKKFVEKYEPDQKDEEPLKGITLEDKNQHFEKEDAKSNIENSPQKISIESLEKIHLASTLKPWQLIPEFLGIVVIFFLLLAIGITNIKASTTKKSNPLLVPLLIQAVKPSPTVTPLASPTPNPSPAPLTLEDKEEEIATASADLVEPKTILTIKVEDGVESVNIRQKPTINSQQLGQAKDKETFEFVSLNLGWYEVNLPDGSTGFISAKYIDKGDINSL